MLYLRQATQGAHNPRGGYSFTWCNTELTVTGHSPSGRLPLTRVHTIREEAAPYYENIYIITHGHRAHIPQAGYPLGTHNPWGGCSSVLHGGWPWGQACGVNQQRELLPSQPNTDNRPRAQAHYGFYRDLSLTDDWLISLSCDHTWCCHPVVGNIPFAP